MAALDNKALDKVLFNQFLQTLDNKALDKVLFNQFLQTLDNKALDNQFLTLALSLAITLYTPPINLAAPTPPMMPRE